MKHQQQQPIPTTTSESQKSPPLQQPNSSHSQPSSSSTSHPVPEEPIEAEVEHVDDGDTSAVGRIKALFSMLTRFIGVKDMSQLRVSLPASWLMPMGNLEFWNYCDRPDFMVSIPDPEDPLDRMLQVVRFWFSKDTKWQRGKLAKPYNSILGEEFICHWDVNDTMIQQYVSTPTDASRPGSPRSPKQLLGQSVNPSATSKVEAADTKDGCRVYCITEQISHHPPISAYYYYCKEKGVTVRGVDHLSGKFTGTAIKVFSGAMNKGIFITLETRDNEEYNCTHPTASVAGFLKGDLYIVVSEETIITCPKTKLKAILQYKEEPFFGRAKFAVTGKIVRYDPSEPANSKHKFGDNEIMCTLEGSWKGKINYQKTKASGSPSTSPVELVDLGAIKPFEKIVLPEYEAFPKPSRQVWKDVTAQIVAQNFNEATRFKREVEEEQRKERAAMAQRGEWFQSHWFCFLDDSDLGGVSKEREPRPDEIGAGIAGKPFLRMIRDQDIPWNKK